MPYDTPTLQNDLDALERMLNGDAIALLRKANEALWAVNTKLDDALGRRLDRLSAAMDRAVRQMGTAHADTRRLVAKALQSAVKARRPQAAPAPPQPQTQGATPQELVKALATRAAGLGMSPQELAKGLFLGKDILRRWFGGEPQPAAYDKDLAARLLVKGVLTPEEAQRWKRLNYLPAKAVLQRRLEAAQTPPVPAAPAPVNMLAW